MARAFSSPPAPRPDPSFEAAAVARQRATSGQSLRRLNISNAETSDPTDVQAYASSDSKCHRGGEAKAFTYRRRSSGVADSDDLGAGRNDVGFLLFT
ncbi:hypothetical protein RRF57_009452 [Xylaria bambusicola]|uniref:Uncharacterized protein n=1 Tax=Xylaria bambusicola TaxID=326684 RepID=A0AAN7UV01_9PEZI